MEGTTTGGSKMHGPYTVEITTRDAKLVLTQDDLAAYSRAAERFYSDATPALAEGALRCGVFAAADLLVADEDARVEVFGFAGSGKNETRQAWHYADARRLADGRFASTLGSRFNERVFVGV
jgi:hypothetical protein